MGVWADLFDLFVELTGLQKTVRDRRVDARYRWKMLDVLALFVAYMVVGIVMILWIGTAFERSAQRYSSMIFMALWAMLGTLWVLRLAPYLDSRPPNWLMKKWTVLDWVLLMALLVAAAVTCLN